MLASDLMNKEVVTVREDLPVCDLYDLLQQCNVHGVPVLNDGGELVGFVSQEDIIYGSLGDTADRREITVGEIMTSPALCVGPSTDVREVGRMLWKLRIHHVPVVENGRIHGIVSSMDYCRLVGEGIFEETTPSGTSF